MSMSSSTPVTMSIAQVRAATSASAPVVQVWNVRVHVGGRVRKLDLYACAGRTLAHPQYVSSRDRSNDDLFGLLHTERVSTVSAKF